MSREIRADNKTEDVADQSRAPSTRSELQYRLADMPVTEQLAALQPELPFMPNGGAVQLIRDANAEPATPESGEQKPKSGTITLSVRKGGSPFTSDFWEGLNVGHAWVDIVRPDGQPDSWGFTAADVQNFPVKTPWKDVEGLVLHPDGSSGASAQLPEPVDEEQLEKGEKWAASKQGAKYNLFGLNCAQFASSMFEETTGKSAPSGLFGALIANPNSLSDAVNKKLEKDADKESES